MSIKPIPNLVGYFASEDGKIFSNKRGSLREIKGTIKSWGYYEISIWFDKKCHTKLKHRLIALTFLENPNNLATVNHKDGNKTNNNVSNLEWASQSDNNFHAFANKLRSPILGENNADSKLSNSDVLLMRELKSQGWTLKILSEKFNISSSHVHRITSGKRWKHI